MVRENNENVEDGAGDAMLARQDKEQLAQPNEVKFISAEHKNGDAKIDIGGLEKAFTGMTKEELMRYANDPFWVRLRWLFFILFWGLWVAMLVGAIFIIVGAPKCAAPQPLPWYKQGPLVKIDSHLVDDSQLKSLEAVGAQGVIWRLPAADTYRVHTPEVADKIKQLVANVTSSNIHVILDVTPNYVSKEDELFQNAVANETYRSAFVFRSGSEAPNKWMSKISERGAWEKNEATGQYVLSQFGAGLFDLQMNSTLAKDRFKVVLNELVKLGVKGVRLQNAVHYIINTELKDEIPNTLTTGAVHTDYDYWTHTQTTYQAGLGELLGEFEHLIKNATAGSGFVSVADHIVNPEALFVGGKLPIELPISGTLPRTLASGFTAQTIDQLSRELNQTYNQFLNASWLQWEYDTNHINDGTVGLSEYNFFISLLPGVQVAHAKQLIWEEHANRTANISQLQKLRETPSYMHGVFNVFTKNDTNVIAYTRIKTGNPGYFVAYNPSDVELKVDFSAAKGIPDQMTVNLFSNNYNIDKIEPKFKVQSTEIPISARSVIILTYVPKTDA